MRQSRLAHIVGAIVFAALPGVALAQPGTSANATGSSQAVVVDPILIRKINNLRFGAFAQPAAAAQMTVAQDGTISATGEIASTMDIAQPVDGRGPASFLVDTNGALIFLHFSVPSQIILSNGSNTMRVDNISTNTGIFGLTWSTGEEFTLRLGGRLNVNANQAPGNYTGDFQVTVTYL